MGVVSKMVRSEQSKFITVLERKTDAISMGKMRVTHLQIIVAGSRQRRKYDPPEGVILGLLFKGWCYGFGIKHQN